MKITILKSLVLSMILLPSVAWAQRADTVLSFQDAKTRLVKSNLALLASYYDVNIAKSVYRFPVSNNKLRSTSSNCFSAISAPKRASFTVLVCFPA